jgi:transcriptional regulator with XRE-family HTH domain
MTVLLNERIRGVRLHRRLKSKELARLANVSQGEISLLEKKLRVPKIDTLQKIASALEVSSSFLLGEEDSELPIPAALARQSLRLFLRDNSVIDAETEYLWRVCALDSAPQTRQTWKDLLANISVR